MKLKCYKRLVYIDIDDDTAAAFTDKSDIDSITLYEGLTIPLVLLGRSGNQPGEIPTSGWYVLDIICGKQVNVRSVKRVYSMEESHSSYLITKIAHVMGPNYIQYGFITLTDPASKEQIRVMTGTGWVDEKFDDWYDSSNHTQIVFACLTDTDVYNAGFTFCSNLACVKISDYTFEYLYGKDEINYESRTLKSMIRSMVYEFKNGYPVYFTEFFQPMNKSIDFDGATYVSIKNNYVLVVKENNVTGNTIYELALQPIIRDIRKPVVIKSITKNGEVINGVRWLPMFCESMMES